MRRAIGWKRQEACEGPAERTVTLAHEARHLRRRRLELPGGEAVLVDLPEAVRLGPGDRLVLDDGAEIAIDAAVEPLYTVRGRDQRHLLELTWHCGNRHLAAQIEPDRLLILRDSVIRRMLEGLGATVGELEAAFSPAGGAYHAHDHGHRPVHGSPAPQSVGDDHGHHRHAAAPAP